MKKLKLKDIKVSSFVTELNGKHLKGGIQTNGEIRTRGRACADNGGGNSGDNDDSGFGGSGQSNITKFTICGDIHISIHLC